MSNLAEHRRFLSAELAIPKPDPDKVKIEKSANGKVALIPVRYVTPEQVEEEMPEMLSFVISLNSPIPGNVSQETSDFSDTCLPLDDARELCVQILGQLSQLGDPIASVMISSAAEYMQDQEGDYEG